MFFQLFVHVYRNAPATFRYYDTQLFSYAFQWVPNCTYHPLNPLPLIKFVFSRGKSNENASADHCYQSCQKPSNFTVLSLVSSCFMLVLSTCPHVTIIKLQIFLMLVLSSLKRNPTSSPSNILATNFYSMLPCFKETCLAPIVASIKNYISPQYFSTMSSTKIESIANLITIIVELLSDSGNK